MWWVNKGQLKKVFQLSFDLSLIGKKQKKQVKNKPTVYLGEKERKRIEVYRTAEVQR